MTRWTSFLVTLWLAFAASPALAGTLTLLGAGGPVGGGGGFTFTDRPAAVTSTSFTSNSINAPTSSAISITGSTCQYNVNGGAYTSSSGSVTAGDAVTVKGTSSASVNTALNCALTIGAASDTYTITTLVNTEADAFLKRAITASTDPGSTRDGLYDALFTNLKAGPTCSCNLLSDLDVLYVFAAPDSATSLLNLLSSSFNATAVNAGVGFTADQGWIGDGDAGGAGTRYLNSNFNPSTAGGHFAQDSASAFEYSITNSNNSVWFDIGQVTGTTQLRLDPRATNVLAGRGPNDATTNTFTDPGDSNALFVRTRTSSTNITAYHRSTSLGSVSQASLSMANSNLAFLGNPAVGNGNFSARRLAAGGFGGALTAAKEADLYSALQTLLAAIGASV
jgi:hypothetical protein